MEILTIDEIKAKYPDEWVLVGNPELDSDQLNVLAGLPMLHSKDKKEICYTGRDQVKSLNTYMVIFTGQHRAVRRLTGIFNRIKE